MPNLKCLLCFFFLFAAGGLLGQPQEYLFSHLTVTGGLSNNHITGIYKDARGFMWFGTVSGLNRYDGYQFRQYRHDPRDRWSIADNYIEQIFEGPGGKMWVESRTGRFNLYDYDLDRFDVDFGSYLRQLGLPAFQLVTVVASPASKGYWFIYKDSGVYHYLPDGKIVALRPGKDGEAGAGLAASPVATAREDGNGDCWVLHQDGILELIDGRLGRVRFRSDALQKDFGKALIQSSLFIDGQNDLWICSNGVFKGVYFFHPPTGEWRHLALDAGERVLNSNIVLTALQDRNGAIWLATDHGGVDIVDKKSFSVRFVSHIEDDGKSLADNSITSLYRDGMTGTVWIGTYKAGLSYYHPTDLHFPQYRHEPRKAGTLPYDDVNSFVEDGQGNIWIGGNGGGLVYFDRKRNSFRQWLHDAHDYNSLCSNIIVSLMLDRDGKLWIGTYFGGLDCFDGKRFIHYRHRDDDPASLADDRVMCLCEDLDRQIWVGTLAGGLDRLDRRNKRFFHYKSTLPNSIRNDYISSIIADGEGNVWAGTGYGVEFIERNTGAIRHFIPDASRLSSNNVTWLFLDSRKKLWAGTREGLDVLSADGKTFQSFTTEDGLPDNAVRYIAEDSLHRLWISTANGLSRITVVALPDRAGLTIRCRNFHEPDGLQGREFNERAGLATRDGHLLFGGPNGFNMFRPGDIQPERKTPPILLTGLDIFDKSVHVGDTMNGHVILTKTLSETGEIRLRHKENIFSLEFASLGYIPNATNKYAYTLEGFNHNWLITDGKIRKATYTNLDAGEYFFKVKAADADGEWYDREARLKIVVLPPWWKTPFAYTLYVLLLAASLFIARQMVVQRARMRFALENERRETRRMHEMDLMKIRFFTNMSHELRTPLTLILAPVDKLLDHGSSTDPRRQYEMIRRNAKRLLHLVNQLLDFRKMEARELKLHLREGDVVRFVRETAHSFVDLAEKKNISFVYDAGDCRSLIARFDPDKLERILFNLLSNAFKFTPENGSVRVLVTVERREEENVLLAISIRDTGIGIAPDKQEKIFERFFQNEIPETLINQGSGIGLSITQEFVRMHGGRLSVESAVNAGSCFRVELPLRELPMRELPPVTLPKDAGALELSAEGMVVVGEGPDDLTGEFGEDEALEDETAAGMDLQGPPARAPKDAPTILIVEDNEDFRFYLKDNLRAHYKVIEASDGKEGWRKVLSAHPQLVVSDISMPHMDGIQLCRKIRTDERTKQIPVILLTAMAGESGVLQGLQTGAADYITKPFNFEVLLSKMRNIVEYNETVKKTYQRQVQAGPAPVEVTSEDDVFLRELLGYIEAEMGNAELSVGELCQKFHASRSTFYKRLLLLTGKTPVELIRHIRLKRAAELLEKSQLTVAEVAYTVGFNNPKYFTQYFKEEFGCIPTAWRKEKAR
ncbi:hybrid sensor histidine kinase/response regulator transcription factor [Puia sp.]|jgi:signal transduction histidine kinase/ligand-binding sensor domain-containing protein/DNA-binding response OmpR family regulator|uniref:hybrid sensor histidine kinase/response regulator transcription factor n=1 Tax=Puia sp. TaxID=2045100 RepID=UPI002F40BF79